MAKRGRPCSFDRNDALRSALDVFWATGFEGATMTALKKAMGGICAPSVYAAYGSKEELFKSALAVYQQQECELLWNDFNNNDVRTSIESLLRNVAISYSSPGKPHGCLVDLSTLNFSPANKGIEDYLRTLRLKTLAALQQRLQRGQDEGELPPGADIAALAAFFTTVLQGLSIQARDGAGREQMFAIVDCSMAAWDALLKR